jgi:hypothetical protein
MTYALMGSFAISLYLLAIHLAGASLDRWHYSFRRTLGASLGMALWFHGVLYVMVPIGLASLPLLRYLPIGALILMFLGGGCLLTWRALAPLPRRNRARILLPVLLSLTVLPFAPHDMLRRWRSRPALDALEPRLMLVSFDAMRRDTLERKMPQWRLPEDVQTITPFPSTRLAWNVLLGADPDRTFREDMVPTLWEAQHPEHLKLLVLAKAAKVRTAFAIDDSLSPCFGLQRNLFDTVREPDGGWKYWLSYGQGTCWPLFSWVQNYLSPIETSNPWNDSAAWFRDLGRLLKSHQWVSSHNCQLHPPILLTLGELQVFDPWRWAVHSPLAYLTYDSAKDREGDSFHWRETWRSDGKSQYEVRAGRLLNTSIPFLDLWVREYPSLSGVVLADHGEGFPVVQNAQGHSVTHSSGLHGFGLDPLSVAIPLHPFGVTEARLQPGDVWSLLDLRDSIGRWITSQRPLALGGNAQGWLVQLVTIQPTHLEQGNSGGANDHGKGIRPEEIARKVHLLPNGYWYSNSLENGTSERDPVSSAMVTSGKMVLFNPVDSGRYFRQEIVRGVPQQGTLIAAAGMEREVGAFRGNRVVSNAFQ